MKYARRSFPVMNSARLAVLLVCALFVVLALAACSADRWAGVESGKYTLVRGMESSGTRAIETVRIDRDRQTAMFTFGDGSKIVVSFTPRERSEWPSGCPANIGSTRMEVLDIEEERLDIGTITFDNPLLVRNCPPDPIQVVLREDGVTDGSGSACSQSDKCILFGK